MLTGLRAEGELVTNLLPMLIRELLRVAALARTQAHGGNLAAEMKAQGIWDSKQAPFKRALQRHPTPVRWERFLALASRIERAAKGRADGDPWQLLERLLLAIADEKAVGLLKAGNWE
jgi:DNA polymerase-3 subunit delta